MVLIDKAVKEWNGVVEALGNGKQSILIRKYSTLYNKFFLYPTTSYTSKNNYLKMFKNNYRNFIEKNAFPTIINDKIKIKYYAELIGIVEKPSSEISSINNLHIWTKGHVESYLDGKTAYIWILNVYKINKPFLIEKSNAMLFANLKKELSYDVLKPVLNDKEFEVLIEKILKFEDLKLIK